MKRLTSVILALIMLLALPAATFAEAPVKFTYIDFQAYGLEFMDELMRKFGEENNVEFEIIHSANGYGDIMAGRVNTGDIPDIFQVEAGPAMEPYMEYAVDLTGEPMLEGFVDELLSGVTFDGRVMAVPGGPVCIAFMYNKKVFDEAGITQMPQTIDELEALCEELQSKGITPFAFGHQASWITGQMAASFISQENVLDPMDTIAKLNSGELTFDTLRYYKNVFRVIDLTLKYGVEKTMEYDWERSEVALANGDAAIIHMGSWAEPLLVEFNPDVELAFMPIPVTDDGSAIPRIMAGPTGGWMLSKESADVELLIKFAEYFTTSDEAIEMSSQGLRIIPPTKKQSPNGVAGMLNDSASYYVANGQSTPLIYVSYPLGFEWEHGVLLQAYAAGDMTMEECIAAIQNEWDMAK